MKGHSFCLIVAIVAAGRAQQLPVKAWTTADGLAHNHINRIRQDSLGFLWFGTDEGLSRFDGNEFVNYTTREGLPHPDVNDFLETRDGNYWVASDGGVSRLIPRHKAGESMFTTWRPGPGPDATRVNALVEDASGDIWCATSGGLYRLKRQGEAVKFEHVDLGRPEGWNAMINSLTLDQDGVLWLATNHGLFRRFRDGTVEWYTERDGLPNEFVETLLHDRDGRWWIGTRTAGFCSLVLHPVPGRRVTERCYSKADGLPDNDVRTILRASAGAVWVGTMGGLSDFDPEAPPGAQFRNYRTRNGLTADQIYKLNEDRNGNLWIGTRADGVMKLAREELVSFGDREGFETGTWHPALTETLSGEICIFSGSGVRTGGHPIVQCLQRGRFKTARLNLPEFTSHILFNNRIPAITRQDRSAEWWAWTEHNLLRFTGVSRIEQFAWMSPAAVYSIAQSLPGVYLHECYEDRAGDVWCGAESGAIEVMVRREHTTGRWTLYGTSVGKSVSRAFAEDASGVLWVGFGAEEGGLLRYRGGSFEPLHAAAGSFAGGVRAIYSDSGGRLWVACARAGLVRINDPDSDDPSIASYTKMDGLASNEILSLTADSQGRIYAGLNQGVDRLDPATGLVKHFTSADGLVRGAVEHSLSDRQGRLWFLSDQGISRLIPSVEPPVQLPAVVIRGIRIMGSPVDVSESGETRPLDLELAPGRNEMDIDFAVPNFRAGAPLGYQYQLEGAAKRGWSAASSSRTIHLAGMAPGSYRLLVRAITLEKVASPQPATVAFHVLAPVWQRWWFLALAAIALGLALYAGHQYRIQQILGIERIRSRIAADLHDDVGASLSHIAVLGELARSEAARLSPAIDAQPVQERLARISSVSGELIDSLSDIVWAINPRKDSLNDLSQRMREFAEGVLAPRDIEFHLSAADIAEDRKLGAESRRHLFLIFKECVNNITRHANATRVDCDLRTEARYFALRLQDNGKGFDVANSFMGKGNGLSSILRRTEEMGGRLDIVSGEGQGVTILVNIPVSDRSRKRRVHTNVT